MIFNVSGGGGTALNFRVVGGTTEPSNPKENMIWVNTSTTISSWVFSATQPSNPSNGMVWIFTSTSSTIEFNALKKNSVMVYPLSAKQYVNGAWVDKEPQSYQNGAWVDWIPKGALYWEGNECTSITGGWIAVAKKYQPNSSVTAKAPKVTRHDDYMYATQPGAGSGLLHTANKIDLTGYSKLVVEGEFYATGSSAQNWELSAWSKLGTYYGSNQDATTYIPLKQKATRIELNITTLDGMYFVGFVMNTSGASSSEVGYNKIVKCYLE